MQTIRVWLCVGDPLFNTIGVTLSAQEILPLGSVFCPMVRHLFGTTCSRLVVHNDDKESRCSHLRALALHGAPRKTETPLGKESPCTVRALKFLAVTPNPDSSTKGFPGKPNKCEGILCPSLASSVTPIAMSSRSSSLCGATVESTEF